MKFLENSRHSSEHRSAIMEEGDYNLPPNQVKGMHVDYVFIPECDEEHYTKDNPLYWQLIANISIAGTYYGQILTYKTRKEASD